MQYICEICGCSDSLVQRAAITEPRWIHGHPGDCLFALRTSLITIRAELNDVKIENFSLNERNRECERISHMHSQRYNNLQEALGKQYRTAEEIVGASIAAIHRLNQIRDAVRNVGTHPTYHKDVMDRHRKEWPTLWHIIDTVIGYNS